MAYYWITGKTYPVKDHIRRIGGTWVKERKCWKIKLSGKTDTNYIDLATLGLKLVECEKQEKRSRRKRKVN